MDYVPGIDISKYQTDYSKAPTRFFDPMVARDKGIQFAYIKAGGGILKDIAMDKFAQTFLAAEIPFGFYHYAYPGYSYITQVDKFIEWTKGYKQDLPPVLDVEQDGVGLEFTKAFLGRLESKTGRLPIIYTRASFWEQLTNSENATWALKYPLWVANYLKPDERYHIPDAVYTTKPVVPKPWTNWTFWQYSQSGDGEYYGGNYDPRYENLVALDLNVFNGDYDDFIYFLGGVIPEDPEQPPVIKQKWVRVIPTWLSFRSRPELYPGDRPAIGRGVEAKVLDEIKTDINWYHVELSGGDKGYISAEPGFTDTFYKE